MRRSWPPPGGTRSSLQKTCWNRRWDRLRETDEEYRTTVSHEDELRYLVAETSIDGRTWQLIFVTARYDDRWYLNELGGRLAILLDRAIPHGSGALLVK